MSEVAGEEAASAFLDPAGGGIADSDADAADMLADRLRRDGRGLVVAAAAGISCDLDVVLIFRLVGTDRDGDAGCAGRVDEPATTSSSIAVEATLGGRGIRELSDTEGGRRADVMLLALAALEGLGIDRGIPAGGGIALPTPVLTATPAAWTDDELAVRPSKPCRLGAG